MGNSGQKYSLSRFPHWPAWTGFSGKTLWKWMEMLAVPVMLVILSGVFSNQQAAAAEQQHLNDNKIAQANRAADRQIANDQQEQTTLDNYMTHMSDLLLSTNMSTRLHDSRKTDEVRNVAQAITLTTLDKLKDPERKRTVVTFLYQSDLITYKQVPGYPGHDFPIVNMTTADLSTADLDGMFLSNSALNNLYLMNANLQNAILSKAFLQRF